jgi:hypothetical protein
MTEEELYVYQIICSVLNQLNEEKKTNGIQNIEGHGF